MGKVLTSIYADGLKRLVDQLLEVEPLTALFGDNGAGKTSFLQAIRLTKLGYEPSIGKRLLEVRTQLAAGTANVETGLTFADGFGIRRSFGSSLETRVAPPRSERTGAEMQERINEELGDIILTMDMSELLDLTPEKRRAFVFNVLPRERARLTEERFREALGYQQQHKAVQKAIDKLWLEHVLAGETAVEGLASAIDHANRKMLEAEQGRRSMRHHRAELEAALDRARKEVTAEDYDPARIEQMQNELEALQAELAAMNARNVERASLHQERERVSATRERKRLSLKERQEELARARKGRAALGTPPDAQALQAAWMEVDERRRQQQEKLIAASQMVEGLHDTLTAAKVELAGLQRSRAAVSDAEVCPTCGSAASLEAYIARLDADIERSARGMGLATVEHQKALEEEAREREEYNRLRGEAEARSRELENADRVVVQIASTDSLIANLERQIAELEEEVRTVDEIPASPALELEDPYELEGGVRSLREKIRAEQAKAGRGSRVQTLEEEVARAEENVALAEARHAALSDLHERLKRLRGEVIRGMMAPVEDTAREILYEIDPAKTFAFQYDREGREVLDFGFEEAGHFRSFNAASTGESALLVVVFLAALLDDLSPPWKVLILDNVEAIYAHRLENLMEAIARIRDRFDNVILAGAVNPLLFEHIPGWKVVDVPALTTPQEAAA